MFNLLRLLIHHAFESLLVVALLTQFGYLFPLLLVEELIQLLSNLGQSCLEAVPKVCLVVAGARLVTVVKRESLDLVRGEELRLLCGQRVAGELLEVRM